MNEHTTAALRALNATFYAEQAAAFDRRRQLPWAGFDELWSRRDRGAWDCREVLDVGCGNGRFARFLAGKLPARSWRYTGVDQCAALLVAAAAAVRSLPGAQLVSLDVLQLPWSQLAARRFDLIVALGLLHHVPGHRLRVRLLQHLARHLTAHGRLVVSLWELLKEPRLRRRQVAWADYNQSAREPIAEAELEEGDVLLRFGDGDGPPRYCHSFDAAEAQRLVAAIPLDLEAEFCADGPGDDLNRYLVWRPPSG